MVAASSRGMPPLPHTLLARMTYAVFTVICLFALWKGGRLEKASGLVLLLANLTTSIIQDRVHWMDPQARFLIEDCLLLIFFLGLALSYGRIWMIFAAAFQLLSTLSHPAAHFARQIGPTAYIAIFQLFSYGVFISLAVGVAADQEGGRVLGRYYENGFGATWRV